MSPIKRPSAVWRLFGRPNTTAIVVGAAVAIGVLAANVVVTYHNTQQLERDTHLVAHSFEAIGSMERVLSDVKDAEAGQRGYIITQDPRYLELYHSAVTRVDAAVADVERLTEDNAGQQARMPKLREILAARLQSLEDSLDRTKEVGIEGARQVILSGRGMKQMNQLRSLVSEMANTERELLATRQTVSAAAYQKAILAGALSGLAALAAIIALVAIFVVSTFRGRRAEEQQRVHLQELAHASRLAAMGQMMSELSHELNQPLAAAANYSRACANLARGDDLPNLQQLADLSDKAAEQSSRAVEIVKRVNTFAKKGTGQRTRVNLNDLVENVVALTLPSMRGKNGVAIAATMDLGDDVPEVAVDRVQIEQVLVNLIRNATEAMQTPECHVKALALATRRQGDVVEVSVRDHGPGIPPETMKQLFSPYFTTKSQGMGLGLSISRSIVEEHAGKISAESSERGTNFRFTLPIAAA